MEMKQGSDDPSLVVAPFDSAIETRIRCALRNVPLKFATDYRNAIRGTFDSIVRLDGLLKRPELNGRFGVFVRTTDLHGKDLPARWPIRLFEEDSFHVHLYEFYAGTLKNHIWHDNLDCKKVALQQPMSISVECFKLIEVSQFAGDFATELGTLLKD